MDPILMMRPCPCGSTGQRLVVAMTPNTFASNSAADGRGAGLRSGAGAPIPALLIGLQAMVTHHGGNGVTRGREMEAWSVTSRRIGIRRGPALR